MSSMNVMINKLMKALECEKGIVYCLDRVQYYSNEHKKRFTKYVLHRKYVNENGDMIKENHQFNKPLDLVLFLSEQLGIGGVKT